MYKSRGLVTVSLLNHKTLMTGWCRPRMRRLRRRRATTVRLGNRRRGFSMGPRTVVHWSCMAGTLKVLKKFIVEMGGHGRWIDAYFRALSILRPQVFPLC
ncbi:hypothetical protein RND81_10G233600 [Saponaria officinalis]|uniref:Uncharacterized protein n=1 Tax=Saponaria officinalis TaxID=3572 RepID=A0AAW1I677_SAPOF